MLLQKNKIFSFIKHNIKYLVVFLIALGAFVFFSYLNSYDAIWNFGFSYAFAIGETPFKDFNMITPGFYNFVMSLGLHLSHNYLVFLIEQAFLITLTFYIVYKLYGKKAWLFLFFMTFPMLYAFSPTYNFFLMFLTILIIYLEKKESSDYLIGFLLGLCILTKHTVGVFLVIPSFIFYFKDKSKLFKRFLGCLIPCIIFIIYLLVVGAFKDFFDLCVLGLFDFASKNGEFITFYVVSTFILLIIGILYVTFNRKDILGYYVLCFFSVMLPIFSYYHFSLYLAICSLLILSKLKVSDKYVGFLGILLTILPFLLQIFLVPSKGGFFNIKNFDYIYESYDSKMHFVYLNKLYLKYKKELSNTNIFLVKVFGLRYLMKKS